MRNMRVLFTFLLLFLFVTPTAWASSDDHLLDLLIRKGVITRDEGTSLKKEAEKETASSPSVLPKALQGLKVGMLGYFDYSAGETGTASGGGDSYNRFTVTRGYLTVEKAILPWMGARMTSDLHQDSTGDWKFRMKYFFAELRPSDLGPLTNMKAEIGQGHIPWLDFEEHVNPYRAQGTMAIERAGIFNSADMGLSLRGNFDGKLENAKSLTGNSHYDGRYGSWHLGVYDGGGYHASEKNNNKVAEGRLTVRPLPESLPGLQLSYLGIYGDGNTAAAPDYHVNLGMISYEHPMAILTAQYFTTKGNASGTLVDSTGESLNTKGYSLFGRVKLPVMQEKLALFGRYDHFDPDKDGVISSKAAYDLSLGGLSYELYKGNMVLLTYERTNHEDDSNGLGVVPVVGTKLGDDHKVQLVYQLKY